MKKHYLFLGMMAIAALSFGQQKAGNVSVMPVSTQGIGQGNSTTAAGLDTLANHFVGGTPALYSSSNGGFVCGHNGYSDLSKAQLFDNQMGVTGPGTIPSVLLWVGAKEGNPASTIAVKIYADNNGVPGATLGSVNVPFSAMDTNAIALMQIGSPIEAAYNTIAVFSSPIAIPANGKFWAGFTVTYASGDTIGVVTTTHPEFSLAVTHSFEQWSDNSWHTYNDGTTNTWQLDIAQGIFPVCNFSAASVNENGNISFGMFPNPAVNQVTVNLPKGITNGTVNIVNVIGETVFTSAINGNTMNIDLSGFAKGSYFLNVNTLEGKGTQKLMIH
jgi:hypothetical protein